MPANDPNLAIIHDHIYPYEGIQWRRNTVRGVILNEKNEVAILHIKCKDQFGDRDHYELPGGGVELGESLEQTLHREMSEELGASISILSFLGIISLDYNLLHRTDVAHFFMAKVVSVGMTQFTKEEESFIESIQWIKIDELIIHLATNPQKGVGQLIHSRDLIALKVANSLILGK